MATRSEQFRASAERKGTKSTKTKGAPKAARAKRAASRKPRVKTDAPLNIREELVKGSPEQSFRKTRAKRTRARASR